MTRVLVVADDLTGAADSAAPFVKQGFSTCLVFNPEIVIPDAEIVAFSSETRNLALASAKPRLRNLLPRLRGYQPEWLFCKIDSQLRGHPGVSLAEMMAAWAITGAVIAPAFPAQGRVTRAGDQYVNGKLLAETSVGSEVGTSRVSEVFMRGGKLGLTPLSLADARAGVEQLSRRLAALSPACFVADAELDDDLTALVAASEQAGIRLLCGSAGLAGALARRLQTGGKTLPPTLGAKVETRDGDVMVVATSYHPATRAQVEELQRRGIRVVEVAHADLMGTIEPGNTLDWIRRLRVEAHGCIVLTLPALPMIEGQSANLARGLAKIVKIACQERPPAGMVLTGGDAAAAVCAELGFSALRLGGEVQAGIPWGILAGGALPGLRVVTKSGGFGEKQALWDSFQFIAAQNKTNSR